MENSKVKEETVLGLTYKKDESFWKWYSEVVANGEMIEHYEISGLFTLLPWAISVWEIIKSFFDAEIKKMKIKNCYFPLFVSPVNLKKQKDHGE
ncbi:unnamed protein product [Cuscuta epithymum]|nr:unnamed protein product [Cuscuta epithymum]